MNILSAEPLGTLIFKKNWKYAHLCTYLVVSTYIEKS